MPGLMGLVLSPILWHHHPPSQLLAPGPRSLWARWLVSGSRLLIPLLFTAVSVLLLSVPDGEVGGLPGPHAAGDAGRLTMVGSWAPPLTSEPRCFVVSEERGMHHRTFSRLCSQLFRACSANFANLVTMVLST